MDYNVKFRHIDKDFGFTSLDEGSWSADYANEDDFILALNRMAIATSQHSVIEFPEAEVRAKTMRVTIQAIEGQLFYTDLHSQNRKNMKVVPVEVVRLIEGRPLNEVFRHEDDEEEHYVPRSHSYRGSSKGSGKVFAFVVMFAVLALLAWSSWREYSRSPSLTASHQFIPNINEEGELLRKHADVYISEYREGAMILELTAEGQFSRYEMWFSEERNGFILLNLDSYRVQGGSNLGVPAFLAGEKHIISLVDDETITLHGVTFTRYHDQLSSIGEILTR